jgi:hypothetical protein
MDELLTITSAAVAIFAAMLLAQAAWHKFSDREAFAQALKDYELLPSYTLGAATLMFIAAEAVIAVMLLSPFAVIGLHKAAILLVVYAMAMGVALSRGQRLANCACGSLQEKHALGPYQVWRNAVLVTALTLASLKISYADMTALWQWGLALTLAVVFALFYAMAEQIHINYQNKKQLDVRYE